MKIIAYNINRYSQEKVDKILAMGADVFILPEVACPKLVNLPEGYQMEWMGNNDWKGLGVIWKTKLKVNVPEWYNPKLEFMLPLMVDKKLIMAAWPTRTDRNAPRDYPQIAMEALQYYEPRLTKLKTIILGDMNCYKGQSGERYGYSIEAIVNYLQGLGLKSAYHEMTGESIGSETKGTYHHWFRENMTFFLDYTFTNIPLKSYSLMEWDREISDHVGQVFEIDI